MAREARPQSRAADLGAKSSLMSTLRPKARESASQPIARPAKYMAIERMKNMGRQLALSIFNQLRKSDRKALP